VARDATARLYDVDANTILLNKKAGTITFQAKNGRIVNLDQLHESIWATRLGDNTGMQLLKLQVTVQGELSGSGQVLKLTVPGTDRYFVLKEGSAPVLQRLREKLQGGNKIVRVSGVVEGWQGNFTQFLRQLPGQPRTLLVQEIHTVKDR
jgi:hypothetical protein